jgi:predicted nucleic acid-binding protein
MSSVLIDTNILVYAFDPRDIERQEQAFLILSHLEDRALGCLSVQCLSEFLSVVLSKKILDINEAIQKVAEWPLVFPVFDLTPQIVLEAARGLREYQLSYYDAQIWACARLNQVPMIFSEDFQNGQILEGVRFVNPFSESFLLAD